MPALRFYIQQLDGKTYCTTLAEMKGKEFDFSDEDGKHKRKIKTEREVHAFFNDSGRWFTVNTYAELRGEDEEKIESKLWAQDEVRGLIRNTMRRAAAVVETCVSDWDLTEGFVENGRPIPITFDDFQELPQMVRAQIGAGVMNAMYYGMETHPSFTRLSTDN